MRGGLVIDGASIDPGARQMVRINVTEDLNGQPVDLVVHGIAGTRPGPTLTLVSTLHGGEWLPLEFLRRFVTGLDPELMTGNLIVLPVANPVAFLTLSRATSQPEADAIDLNRAFPGQWDTIVEQLARAIVEKILSATDYLIDYHGGGFARAMGDVSYGLDFPDPAIVSASKEMAKAFGYYAIQVGNVASEFPGPRSLKGYSGAKLGIPNIGVEIGAAGMGRDLEEGYLEKLRAGTLSVMKHLGMLPGKPSYADRYLVFEKRWRVHPTRAGYLLPVLQPEEQGREVRQGEVLGRVFSPYTFEEVEVLRSPCDGVAFYVCRPYPVRPGDWAFGIADLTHPKTRWVRPDEI